MKRRSFFWAPRNLKFFRVVIVLGVPEGGGAGLGEGESCTFLVFEG